MKIELLDPATADFEELASLHREAFKGVTGTSTFRTVLGKLLNAEHYQHKYNTPAGPAKIVAIREDGRLLATNAMFPEFLRHEAGISRAWQSCDTATHPNGRGRGFFVTCLKTLKEQLSDGDVFFGYPNANSTPGFAKIFRSIAVLDAYVSVFPWPPQDCAIVPVDQFDARQDDLAVRLIRPGTVMIDRSASYLNWRYFSVPNSPYAAFVYCVSDKFEGFAVVRTLPSPLGNLCLIMELFGTTPAIEGALSRAAIRWGWQTTNRPTLFLSNCWGDHTWLRHAFVRIPRRLSPRQLLLMATGIGMAGQETCDLNWRAFAGDWDVF